MKTIKQGKYLFELDTTANGRLIARLINSNAQKAYNRVVESYWFRTEEQRTDWVKSKIEGIKAHEKRIAERKAERKAFKTSLKKGDILNNSWGYDQTNVDFFKVVEVPSAKRVVVVKIGSELKQGEGYSPMAGTVTPDESRILSKPFKCVVKRGDYVSVAGSRYSFEDASKWNGRPKYNSWYA